MGAEVLKDLRYAVFGCGNSLYNDDFNKASVQHLHCGPESSRSLLTADSEVTAAFHVIKICVCTLGDQAEYPA